MYGSCKQLGIGILFAVALALPHSGFGAEPTPEDLLRRYDAVMSPITFDGLLVMIAHRQDDTTRSYKFRALKSKDDKIRTWFFEPAAAKGQEMLRVEDNMWVYMPNLKRSLRLASRESFQGGDFNNGDVLRVNYIADYTAKFVPSGDPKLLAMELTAKTQEASVRQDQAVDDDYRRTSSSRPRPSTMRLRARCCARRCSRTSRTSTATSGRRTS